MELGWDDKQCYIITEMSNNAVTLHVLASISIVESFHLTYVFHTYDNM